MANTIKLKRGTGSDPSASDLVLGEIAIRTDTGKLFTKKDNGTVAEISGSGGGGSDIFINTLSSSSGSGGGSASFNGSATRFTLSNPPDVSAQQLLVSINGVIQKPNSGTSPSEGFALDGTDIIFAAAPATGSDFFIITYGSIGISVPADDSVTSAKIVDGTIVGTDLATNIDLVDNQTIRLGTGNDLRIYHDGLNSYVQDNGTGKLVLATNGTHINLYDTANSASLAKFQTGASVELYYDNAKKFETTSTGASVTGALSVGVTSAINNNVAHLRLADSSIATPSNQSVLLVENNTNAWITIGSGASSYGGILFGDSGAAGRGQVRYNHNGDIMQLIANEETLAQFTLNGAVELYFDNSKKVETYNAGLKLAQNLWLPTGSGGAFFDDNIEAKFGIDQDLKIYHNGSNSFIKNNTGYLVISSENGSTYYDANNHYFRKADSSEVMAKFFQDGDVELYYDGSKKFETTSYGALLGNNTSSSVASPVRLSLGGTYHNQGGIDPKLSIWTNGTEHMGFGVSSNQLDVILTQNDYDFVVYGGDSGNDERFRVYGDSTGIQLPDSSKAIFGGGSDLQIYHDGSNSYVQDTGTGDLRLKGSTIRFRSTTSESMIGAFENGAVEIYYDNSKKFGTDSGGAQVFGILRFDDGSSTTNHLNFGNSADLKIYHDGNSRIDHSGGGVLVIRTLDSSEDIQLISARDILLRPQGGESGININGNGAVDLYYDNGKKFETRSDGVKLSQGHFYADDSSQIRLGDSQDLKIYHDGSDSIIHQDGTGDLRIRSDNSLEFNTAGQENAIWCDANAAVKLYYDNSLKLKTNSAGVEISGHIYQSDNYKLLLGNAQDLQIVHNGTSSFIDNHNSGHIYIRNNDGSDFGGNIYIQAKSGESSIDIIHDGSVQLFYNNDRVFYTETRGVRIGDNTKIFENSSQNTAVIQHADIHHAIIFRGATNNNGSTITNENTTTFREYGQMVFRTGGNGNSPVRLTIASNGVVSGNLNDTSDEKFKENIVSIADGAITKIKQLRPVNFDWKKEMEVEDAKGESGFIAQEVLTVIPDLVKGIEYKEDEKSSGYSVNTTGLVAYLTKALQEVIARLETLEGG